MNEVQELAVALAIKREAHLKALDEERRTRINLKALEGFDPHDYDKLVYEWEQQDQRRAKHRIRTLLWDKVWTVRRFLRDQVWYHHWTYAIKNFVQRGHRGWGTRDWWNLNDYLASWMPAALRTLATKSHGRPMDIQDAAGKSLLYDETGTALDVVHLRNIGTLDLDDEEPDAAEVIWAETLEKMALGFEAFKVLNDEGWRHEWEEEKRLEEIRREGMLLFMHNYYALWD